MQSHPSLAIGYLWQYDGFGEPRPSASVLHISAIVGRLRARGHRVRTVTLDGNRPCWSDDLEAWTACATTQPSSMLRAFESSVRGVQSRLRLPYVNLFESERFAQACASVLAGCDVLYERYWIMNSGGVIAARRLGIPIVLEVNGDVLGEHDSLGTQLGGPQRRAIGLLNRWIFHRASHVVAVSETLRASTIERWNLPADKVSVVHNGADVESFASARADPGKGCETIAFVGTFKPWHGLSILVSAFASIAARHRKARLLLVGDGPMRRAIETQVAGAPLSDRVELAGAVAHHRVPELLAGCAIGVVGTEPSVAAAAQCPLKLFEYMAAGLAIVAPDSPNIREILQHDVSGLLYQAGCRASLATALDRLLSDGALRARLGAEAQRRALAGHSWAAGAAQIEGILRALCDRSTAGVRRA